MTASATVVWLAPVPADAAEERAMVAWARVHHTELTQPPDEGPERLTSDPRDPSVAASVDDLLDRARDAVTERDGAGADDAIRRAEQILEPHPELPFTAWLMAEVLRVKSTRLRRVPPIDVAAADRSWQRAAALDGGRIAGVGEEAAPASARPATLVLGGVRGEGVRGEQAWLDGALVASGPVASTEGPHALVATWRGAPVWAAWLDAPSGTTVVPWPAPAAPPCSRTDVEGVRVRAGKVVASADVRCNRWVAATTGLVANAVRIATCEAGRCEDLLDWQPAPDWNAISAQKLPSRWPAWGTWAVVGAGVAAAAGVVVGIASASQGASGETRFVSGGLKTPP